MRALKTLVIVLGLLIVAGFGVMIYGLSQNWHRVSTRPVPPASMPTSTVPAEAPATAVAAWGRVSLGLSADSRIQSVSAAGRLIVVHVAGNDERLVVLDPATGAVVGTFAVSGQP